MADKKKQPDKPMPDDDQKLLADVLELAHVLRTNPAHQEDVTSWIDEIKQNIWKSIINGNLPLN